MALDHVVRHRELDRQSGESVTHFDVDRNEAVVRVTQSHQPYGRVHIYLRDNCGDSSSAYLTPEEAISIAQALINAAIN